MPHAGLTRTWSIYKTTDGGSSWQETGKPDATDLERLVVDSAGRNLYAVTKSHSLFISSDGGNTWQGPH